MNNNKSLENQHDILGKELLEKNISVEVRNMFIKLLNYYEKYNNEYAKHDDSTNEEELDFFDIFNWKFFEVSYKDKIRKTEKSQKEQLNKIVSQKRREVEK